MKIGIFGGTFDPIHNEHIKICLSAKHELGLDKIIVLPSGKPPHKSIKNVSADKLVRFEMAKLAFSDFDFVKVQDYELNLNTPNYTYQTLEYFSERYKGSDLFFIMGGDSLIDFFTWKQPYKILEKAHIVACKRKGFSNDKLRAAISKLGNRLTVCDYVGQELSSSQIRVFLEFDIDCTDMLPIKVNNYIKDNRLYKNFEFYISKLKLLLSANRYNHTVYTVIEALKLAKILKVDLNKAFIAAALHDCSKKLSLETLEREYGFKLKDKNIPEPVIHSISGSFLAETFFNIKDEDILNSIRYHTTGRPNMSDLEKIIYVADCIEKTRDYQGIESLRKTVYEDFEKGFVLCMHQTMKQLNDSKNKQEISDLTLKAYKHYTK